MTANPPFFGMLRTLFLAFVVCMIKAHTGLLHPVAANRQSIPLHPRPYARPGLGMRMGGDGGSRTRVLFSRSHLRQQQ